SRPASPVCAARTTHRVPRQRPPAVPGTHQMALRPSTSPQRVPLPSPPESSLPALADPKSDSLRAASPTVTRFLATVVTDPSFESTAASALVAELVDFAAHRRLDYAASLVAESESVCPPSVGGECALSTDVLEDTQEEFQCFAAALPHLVSMLLAPEGDPDEPDILTPHSYAEAIEGTYVDEVPPPGANIVSGMWIFRVKRLPGSPPVFKARYVARGFSQRQGVDYFQTFSSTPKMTTLRVLLHVAAQRNHELHSLDLSTAFLQGNLHEEIWLRHPPCFTGTTLAALGFAHSTADPSLFLRTDSLLPPFYILVYVDDLVFATADTAGLTHVKSELQKRHTCTYLAELRSYLGLQITRDRARRTITLTQSHMVQQVLQRFDFTYSSPQATPLSTRHSLSALPSDDILARYVAAGRHRPEHMAAAKRVLRYLCSTSGMGFVLGGQSPVVLNGHADAFWVDDLATQRSSQGYTFSLAEIYAEAMAAQGLRWLTYLLTDLGEQPRSPPVLYVDNKAMLALCREHRQEHRTKHIALRYFLARELQQRGQLRLAYVASQANTADIFTKALQPCDHQRFCTMLACFALLCLTGLVTPSSPPLCLWGSGGTSARRVDSGGGQHYLQQRRSETPSPEQLREWFLRGASRGCCPYVIRTGDRAGQTCGRLHTQHPCFSRLDDDWRADFGDDVELPRWEDLLKSRIAIFDLEFDAILSAMYALSVSAEGDFYRCVPPDPGIAAAALGESGTLPGTAPTEALHTFTLDSGASRCFFRDSTTLTPLPAPVPVRLADPSGGPVVARSCTVLPCPAVSSGSLSGLHLPSFSTNLVSTAALQDAMVTTTTPGGSSLYTLTSEPSQVAASAQVSASGQVAASFSCHLLSHQTLLWHHRLSHPSLPRLRGMHSRLLVSGLPRSLPPLLPLPAPPCLPCVEGRQRAAPHSSSFPSTTAPLQTLHMDVWGPARVSGQGCKRYFLLVVDDYTRYTTVFPLRSKGQVVDVLIPWIRTVRLQLREQFHQDLPVLRLHSNRGGEFSSTLLRDFCRREGILQSFTLPESPQQNGISERRIGLVMEVARTSMIHAAAPHFLWPFAVRYAAHQLNLRPRVSLPETLPTLCWTGEVGDASVFRVWGFRAFVRDTSADKLSPRAIPCVFLGFVLDAPGWQFYHPTSHHIFPSQDATFNESVTFYRLFPYRSTPPLPLPLFLAPGPPSVDPLPPKGPAPSSVSQVDPLLGPAPVQVALDSGAARGVASGGAEPGGAASGGAEPRGAESEGAEIGGFEPGGVETGGAKPGGVATGGAEPEGVERGGAASEGVASGGAEHQGAASSGASGAGGAGTAGAGGNGVAAGAGVTGGTATAGPRGARTRGIGASGTGVVEGAGVGVLTESGTTGAGGVGDGGAGVGGPGAGGARAGGEGAADHGGTVRPRLYFVPLLQQVLERPAPASRPVSPIRTTCCVPRSRPPPVPGMHAMTLRPSSVPLRVPLPAPPESSLPEVPDPESDRARTASPSVSRLLATSVTDPSFEFAAASALVAELLDFAAACRLDYATSLVAESESANPPSVGGECALGTDFLEDRQEDFECLAAAVPRFASMLLAPEGDPDAPDIPTSRSYAEAITGPYSSQWVKRPLGSPPAFKARYVARGFSQRQGVDYFQTFYPTPKMTSLLVLLHVAAQRDYELHSLDFSPTFLLGSLHEEIWTTLAALGFAPATADPSLFLRTGTSLPPFYVLVYVDDLVFATTDIEALTLVKSELQKRHTCTDLGELRSYLGLQITRDRARRTITLTQSHMVHQSVEPSGPYPELVGCLMYLMTCTRPDLAYPLSLLARYVAPVRQAWGLCLEDGFLLSSSVTQTPPGSSCEAEIYAGAMAAQELRWLTYLLTDFGEQPRSPPVLYIDNKAMIALYQEHRMEHRTKHITLRYFLARELQQRGQLRLAYVATRANTADVFTKALPPGDHQRFVTVLGLLALFFLDWSCDHLGTVAEGASTGDAGAGRDESGGARGVGAEAPFVEDTAALHWRPRPASPPGFLSEWERVERVEEEHKEEQQEQLQPQQDQQQEKVQPQETPEEAQQQRQRELRDLAPARFVCGPLPSPPVPPDKSLSLSLFSRRAPLNRVVSPGSRLPRYRVDDPFHLVLRSRITPPPVLPSPPVSSLPVPPALSSDSRCATRLVVARFLSLLVPLPTAPPSFSLALAAVVSEFASSHRLEYAAQLVSGPARSPSFGGAPIFDSGGQAVRDQFLPLFLTSAPCKLPLRGIQTPLTSRSLALMRRRSQDLGPRTG
ncbi:unnamed protein product, partial [Closterium sp. NIES-53]